MLQLKKELFTRKEELTITKEELHTFQTFVNHAKRA
jgi:hypothetical protein